MVIGGPVESERADLTGRGPCGTGCKAIEGGQIMPQKSVEELRPAEGGGSVERKCRSRNGRAAVARPRCGAYLRVGQPRGEGFKD